jgi:hypothetical protein
MYTSFSKSSILEYKTVRAYLKATGLGLGPFRRTYSQDCALNELYACLVSRSRYKRAALCGTYGTSRTDDRFLYLLSVDVRSKSFSDRDRKRFVEDVRFVAQLLEKDPDYEINRRRDVLSFSWELFPYSFL